MKKRAIEVRKRERERREEAVIISVDEYRKATDYVSVFGQFSIHT